MTDTPTTQEPEFGDTRQAEEFSRLSLPTLKRRQAAGADVGLRKSGRRIIFHMPTLRKYLLAQVETKATN